jgi:hypothetical protein
MIHLMISDSCSCSIMLPCSTVQYSTVQYSTVQYSTVQYNTIQYGMVWYSTVQCSNSARGCLVVPACLPCLLKAAHALSCCSAYARVAVQHARLRSRASTANVVEGWKHPVSCKLVHQQLHHRTPAKLEHTQRICCFRGHQPPCPQYDNNGSP